MPFPPVPESPFRQAAVSKSSGTPRVGMQLYSDGEDDDVSVLTFHTLGTKDAGVGGSGSSFVKSARESLERMVMEGKTSGSGSGDEDGIASLSRISEEGGSQFSSSSHSKSVSKSSSKSSSARSDAENDDDDTISMAESILDSASKVLSSIGSSPYYGRGKRRSPAGRKSPTRNSERNPSPTKQHSKGDKATSEVRDQPEKAKNPHTSYSTNEKQLEVSSSFLSSYFGDENTDPARQPHSSNNKGSSGGTSPKYQTEKMGHSRNDDSDTRLQKLESETRQLHMLLKERQLETKRASQSLGSSIRRANELLDRISAGGV